MKKKKAGIILLVLGILSIVSGMCVQFVYSLKNDREATLVRMEDIKNEYRNFSNSIDIFNDIRNSLYSNVFEDIYYDTMQEKDFVVKEALTDYEVSVNNIETSALSLSKLCDDIYFPDNNINNKCDSFSGVYEQIINAFVTDVNFYNGNISKYNEYQSENGTTNVLENYSTTKEYIDYNNDKKYDGKEE